MRRRPFLVGNSVLRRGHDGAKQYLPVTLFIYIALHARGARACVRSIAAQFHLSKRARNSAKTRCDLERMWKNRGDVFAKSMGGIAGYCDVKKSLHFIKKYVRYKIYSEKSETGETSKITDVRNPPWSQTKNDPTKSKATKLQVASMQQNNTEPHSHIHTHRDGTRRELSTPAPGVCLGSGLFLL